MKVVDNKLRCMFCEEFYCYDMSKEWLDYIANKSHGTTTVQTEPNKNSRKKRTP